MFWKKKKEGKTANETALRLDGRQLSSLALRYMDENGSPQEVGLGRGGRVDTANGHVLLWNENKEVFYNSDISSVECAELMSKNGAIFTGINEFSGREETIVVYYTKWQ